MAYGYSAMVFDQRVFVTYNPFNLYVTQVGAGWTAKGGWLAGKWRIMTLSSSTQSTWAVQHQQQGRGFKTKRANTETTSMQSAKQQQLL